MGSTFFPCVCDDAWPSRGRNWNPALLVQWRREVTRISEADRTPMRLRKRSSGGIFPMPLLGRRESNGPDPDTREACTKAGSTKMRIEGAEMPQIAIFQAGWLISPCPQQGKCKEEPFPMLLAQFAYPLPTPTWLGNQADANVPNLPQIATNADQMATMAATTTQVGMLADGWQITCIATRNPLQPTCRMGTRSLLAGLNVRVLLQDCC